MGAAYLYASNPSGQDGHEMGRTCIRPSHSMPVTETKELPRERLPDAQQNTRQKLRQSLGRLRIRAVKPSIRRGTSHAKL